MMKSFSFTVPIHPDSRTWGMNGVYSQTKHWNIKSPVKVSHWMPLPGGEET